MVTLDSGLLFWATLYFQVQEAREALKTSKVFYVNITINKQQMRDALLVSLGYSFLTHQTVCYFLSKWNLF